MLSLHNILLLLFLNIVIVTTWCDVMWRDVTHFSLMFFCFCTLRGSLSYLSLILMRPFHLSFFWLSLWLDAQFLFFIWIKKIKRVVFSSSSWSDVYFTTFIYFLYLPWWPFFVYRYWTKNQHTKFVSIFRDLLWVKKFEKIFVLNVLKKSDTDS